jgi:hypothetical protein
LLSRRTFCKTAGIAAAGLALPLSGCIKTPPVEELPTVFSVEELAAKRAEIAPYQELLQVHDGYIIALNSDGTVQATGRNSNGVCEVSDWEDVISIRTNGICTFGLKRDGTIYVTDYTEDKYNSSEYGFSAALQWNDVIRIELGSSNIFGITSSGRVLAAGNNGYHQIDVSDWTDIVALSSDFYHTLGLKADGTVTMAGATPSEQSEVEGWADVAAVYAHFSGTFGLTSDGRVLTAGWNPVAAEMEDWTGIVELCPSRGLATGLRTDGTMVGADEPYLREWRNTIAFGSNEDQSIVFFGIDANRNILLSKVLNYNWSQESLRTLSAWSDIVAVSGISPYVALKSDGTVLSLYSEVTGSDGTVYPIDVSDWKLF